MQNGAQKLRIDYYFFFVFLQIPDMIAATSVLQQKAGDIRQSKINWQSYMQ